MLQGSFDQRKLNGKTIMSAFKNFNGVQIGEQKEENDIQKGEIADSLSYGSTSDKFTFKKKGSEIATKLTALKVALEAGATKAQTQLDALEEEIGAAPTDTMNSYTFKKIIVNRYAYKQYYAEKSDGYAVATDDTVLCDASLCQRYNDISYNLRNVLEDIEAVRILAENIDSKKEYELSMRQLVMLGF